MARTLEPYQLVERSIITKYRKVLWNPFIEAVKRYEMIQPGDRIAVCISGGKDSMLLAKLMQQLQKHSDFPFELVFLVMDPGYNELNRRKIESNAALLNIPVTIFESDIFEVADSAGKSPCYLCARMRRGYLYRRAMDLGCNKIAYAHHEDDVVETMMLSLFYEGRLHTFSPVTHLDKTGLTVIRPLIYMREAEVIGFVNKYQVPVVKSPCPADGHTKREYIKELLQQIHRENPGVRDRIFTAIQRGNMEGWSDYFGSH